MNDFQRKDLSIYRLALEVQTPPEVLVVNPATLLSLVRSQIDVLISQQITATFWVKLPPGKIWQAELLRYQSFIGKSGTIYNCQIGNNEQVETPHHVCIQLISNRQLQREYFLVVLSPQFCSLIVAHRPLRKNQIHAIGQINPPILAINTIDGKVIQPVLDGIKQATLATSAPIASTNLIDRSVYEPTIINLLLSRQIQRQDEINRHIQNKRIVQLQHQNRQLQHKEQQQNEYFRNVCHELRTPLTQMKTALSLLNSPSLKPLQRQRYLQMLNTQCDRQRNLITGLLDLVDLEYNLEKKSLELINLADIVPGIVSTYQPVAQEKGITLSYTVSTELPNVWCVIGGVRQIVISLLHNSIKFTPDGGKVSVKTRLQGDYVQLEFRDTGIGISENEIPNIFDCFYRVRSGVTEDVSGAGLGLTIVKRLLWRCGGSIYVKSKLHQGSTFIVQLPIVGKTPKAIA